VRYSPVAAGVFFGLLIIMMFFPIGCRTTMMGAADGSPDPNSASCQSLMFDHLGTLAGGSPATSLPERTSLDILTRRLRVRAIGASVLVIVGGVAWGWWSGRRLHTDSSPQ